MDEIKKVNVSQDEVRKVSLKLFDKVSEICNDLGINFWVMYGTLIGAVRHEGFIPWDDDFDIAMKRNDYDRFIDYCVKNEDALSPYYLDHFSCNPKCPFYIARICDPKYLLKFDNMSYNSGIFIDLYPLDGMGNNLKYWQSPLNSNYAHIRNRIILAAIWENNLINPFVGSNRVKKLFRGMFGTYAKRHSNLYWMHKLDNISKQFKWEKSKYVGLTGWDRKVTGFKRIWFAETKWLKFEDRLVPVPGEYKKVLTKIYGDYMKLPPKKEQKATHFYTAYKNNVNS